MNPRAPAAAARVAPGQRSVLRREFARLAPRYPAGAARLRQVRDDLEWVRPDKGGVMLDLGCGPGLYTLELARRTGGQVLGADLTEAMLRRAAMRASVLPGNKVCHQGIVGFVGADAHQLPFPTAAFDLLLVGFCFPHFAVPQRVVEEIARVVRPGGRVALFEVVADHPLVNRLERLRESVYTRVLAAGRFVEMFTGAGFRLERRRLSRRRGLFGDWAAASNLAPDSPPLRRARRLLLASAGTAANPLRCRVYRGELEFSHPVVSFLFRRL